MDPSLYLDIDVFIFSLRELEIPFLESLLIILGSWVIY